MDPAEYATEFFRQNSFHRRTCSGCGEPFWTTGDITRCQEGPCTPYGFVGHPPFRRPFAPREMRETYLGFFEKRGHKRVGRYPVIARWRDDVFFVQASIYDFQPWVTSGEIEPPANPLTISQPCLRFLDLEEVGRSGRHFTEFEMMAHHAFNTPDHTVYFKDRTIELCHEFLTSELGADPGGISYKEEVWEGGGNLGPSLSVGISGMEVATLVFMEYLRAGDALRPMPLTVVDTGYGLERLVWASQGTPSGYEAVFGDLMAEFGEGIPIPDAAVLIDHARAVNFLLTDGIVPSNSQEGYYARLLLRRMMRLLAKAPGNPELPGVLERVAREQARDFPEIGQHPEDRRRVVEAEIERFVETLSRARAQVHRSAERIESGGGKVGVSELIEWYDSLGIPPDLAAEEVPNPPPIPADFYAQVAARHEGQQVPANRGKDGPTPADLGKFPATEVLYYEDPYTTDFRSHVLWSDRDLVLLDRTYFYPTGGGQITDTGHLGEVPVVEVLREGAHVLHRLDQQSPFQPGETIRGRIDEARRRQLMQHHTATHLLNGALREVLGPHVWQAGAFKSPELARIDITHFRSLTSDELAQVDRRANLVIRENRPVRSYFESRGEAERRFGFTLYQGGAVPGKRLRIVEIEGFDVEACGGTHCTRTGEVGFVTILGTERIADGVVRLTYAAGDRAIEVKQQHERTLHELGSRLGVAPGELVPRVDRLLTELRTKEKTARNLVGADLESFARQIEQDLGSSRDVGEIRLTTRQVELGMREMQELCRKLTSVPQRVAILVTDAGGTGFAIVGSTAPAIPASEILAEMLPEFGGKGGGSAAVATASGRAGEALEQALAKGRTAVVNRASPPG